MSYIKKKITQISVDPHVVAIVVVSMDLFFLSNVHLKLSVKAV